MTNPAQPKPPRKSGWTPERRRKQAEAIKRWKPWAKSTGPRTETGKAHSRYNAWKHGLRGAHHRRLSAVMLEQSRFIRALEHRLILQKKFTKQANELLEKLPLPPSSSRPERSAAEGYSPFVQAGFLGFARNDKGENGSDHGQHSQH